MCFFALILEIVINWAGPWRRSPLQVLGGWPLGHWGEWTHCGKWCWQSLEHCSGGWDGACILSLRRDGEHEDYVGALSNLTITIITRFVSQTLKCLRPLPATASPSRTRSRRGRRGGSSQMLGHRCCQCHSQIPRPTPRLGVPVQCH